MFIFLLNLETKAFPLYFHEKILTFTKHQTRFYSERTNNEKLLLDEKKKKRHQMRNFFF